MERTDRNLDEFIDDLADDRRADLRVLHDRIAPVWEGLPSALFEGIFWSGSEQEIIGYGVHTYPRRDGTEVEWFVVGLALQQQHISLYVNAVQDGKYLSEVEGSELGKVKVGKAAITFKSAADIDLDRLAEFVATARRLHED